MFEKLTAFLDGFLEMGVPGYDCVIHREGVEVYRRFQGYSDLEAGIPMNGRERYRLYSCSKPVTCTAALQLYEKGEFKLEDCLGDYMPEFRHMNVRQKDGTVRPAKNPVRIKDLFCMTAGFSYGPYTDSMRKLKEQEPGSLTTRKVIGYLAREPLWFEPGERWEYSLCHDVLAAFVEEISGETFGEYVRKNIFSTLKMTNSTFCLSEEELDTLTTQYRYDREENRPVNCGKRMQGADLGDVYESGGGGLVSTVEDYIRFLEALRSGQLLREDTLERMSSNQLTGEQLRTFWSKQYGYGLGVRCSRGNDGITDFGWDGMAGAYCAVDRVHHLTVFYAQQVIDSPVHGIRGDVLKYTLEELA